MHLQNHHLEDRNNSNLRKQNWLQLLLFCTTLILTSTPVRAQITPDNTLGAESSLIRPNIFINGANGDTAEPLSGAYRIYGGARRGDNLFHSFSQFNINNGQSVYFTNPSGVENILTRVTGEQPSNIFGTLGVEGTANLFLINPNGIVFGFNARLDVGGSFVATTASAVRFGEIGTFSATNPEAPPLLTINPDALLFNQVRNGSIISNSVAFSGFNPSFRYITWGLRVPDGKSLLLAGGDIQIDSGGLFAFGGRVELGGLASVGTVGLNKDGENLSLSFPNGVEKSDISLSNGAVVDVTAGDGGNVAVNARNLEMTRGSSLSAGIARGMGSASSQAGNIDVNATTAVNLNNTSSIANRVLPEAKGRGGDVSIRTSNLLLQGGAQVGAGTNGAGKGGSLTVDAQDVQLIGTSVDGQSSSGLFASITSTGDGGDLRIKTHSLLVKDGARVSASTFSEGKGGSLTVDAQDVQVIGTSADGQSSSRLSVASYSTGDGGDLRIKTHSLLVKDGAQVTAATFGRGKGGSLTVDAQDVQLIGTMANGQFPSGLFASTERNSTGNAGNLIIKTHSLLVKNGAQVFTGTNGAGKGGSLTVDAQDIQLIGRSTDGWFGSGLFASSYSTGNAGNLIIKTHSLQVLDGAQVSASTFSEGKGGSLTVEAQDVRLIGRSADGQAGSGLFASTESTGDAEGLKIKTHSLLVKDGAQVNASTFSAGKGGSLTVEAQDVQLIGTKAGLFAATESTGNAGDLKMKTHTLIVKDGAQVLASTFSAGKGGSLTVEAQDVQLIGGGSGLSASSISKGNAGDLTIKAHSLLVKDGAQVNASTGGSGNGGSLVIDARDVQLIGGGSGLSASSISKGNAGDLTIKAHSLLVKDGAQVNAGTGGSGKGGSLTVDAHDVQLIGGEGLFASSQSTGDAGDLTIKAHSLLVKDGAQVGTGTFGTGKGGSLVIDAQDVQLIGRSTDGRFGSGLFASSYSAGNAGNLTLNTRRLTVRNGSLVSTATEEGSIGSGGNLVINAQDSVEVTGIFNKDGFPSSLSVRSRGQGKAGNLTVNSPRININDRGVINAESFAVDGGNITLNTNLLLLRRGGTISATAGIDRGAGNGGNITINANHGFIIAVPEENSDIIANAFQGKGGNIQITSQGIFGLTERSQQTEKSDITASSELGIAGAIALVAPDNSALQNSLSELSQNPIDTNALIANSCITRTGSSENTFTITGSGGLPYKPGDASISSYPTGDVRGVVPASSTSWKKGDPIVEPTGVYRLGNGKLVMSRECL